MSAATFKKTSWAVLAAVMLLGNVAQSAEVTRVVSALDDENRFDLNLTVWWLHQVESSLIKRESETAPSPQTDLSNDLKYARSRDVINFRADFGILWDVGLHVQLPLVIADSSSLAADQGVDPQSTTILRDGILPGYMGSAWGQDAPHNRTFSAPSTMVFQSPSRSGFENLGIGLTWAAFNQVRDDTKPTWTLSFDALLDVFKDMRFDPANPTANTAVGPGYHQLIWSTWISKRFRYLDPFVGAWYVLPIRTNGSPFQSYAPTQTSVDPQQQAGVTIGVEHVAWENVPSRQRVTVEARAHLQEFFFGESHSELWQPLSGSSACNANNVSACRQGIDLQYMDGNNLVDRPYPGVTETQAFAAVGGELGLNVQVGKFVRFHGLFGLTANAPHFITAAGAGVDKDGDGRVDSQNPAEASPAYREAIDAPGRRFRIEGSKLWSLFLEGSLMF